MLSQSDDSVLTVSLHLDSLRLVRYCPLQLRTTHRTMGFGVDELRDMISMTFSSLAVSLINGGSTDVSMSMKMRRIMEVA